MESNSKALSAISYLSVFFAPFLVPFVIYFIAKNDETKYHAKRALLSHLLTIVIAIVFFIFVVFTFINAPENALSTTSLIILLASIILFMLIYAVIFIWNIIQAVKVAR